MIKFVENKISMKKFVGVLLLIILFSMGCRKKEDPKPPVTNPPSLSLSFKNMVGADTLTLETASYTNAHGDTFNVSMYKYYISNIVLTKEDGSTFTDTNGYYLVDAEKPLSREIKINNIASGSYTKIQFLVGVDSIRNVSGAQTGALDPFYGMFWDWNSGYIMAKLEGTSPQSPNVSKQFVYHIGGFNGPDNVLKTVELSFPNKAVVVSNSHTVIQINSDILEWFKTPSTISIFNFPGAMNGGKPARTLSDNYADMFTVQYVTTTIE